MRFYRIFRQSIIYSIALVSFTVYPEFMLAQRKFTFNYTQFEKENLDSYRILKDFSYPELPGQDTVNIVQTPSASEISLLPEGSMGLTLQSDTLLPELVERHKYLNKQIESIDGYRVQIFTASRRYLAQQQRAKFEAMYPEIQTYISYEDPYYKIRVGDFLKKREADLFNNQIRGDFPDSFVLSTKVLPPRIAEE